MRENLNLFFFFFVFCRNDFVYDLFAHMNLEEEGGGAGGGRAFKMERRGGAKKKATVSSQFKVGVVNNL